MTRSPGLAPSNPSAARWRRTASAGFSLLELIAAMTILVAMIAMLGRIVTDTQRVWRHGADQAQAASAARAAFALLDADFQNALTSSNLVFVLGSMDAGSVGDVSRVDGTPTELFFHRLSAGMARGIDEAGDVFPTRGLQQMHLLVSTNRHGLATLRRTVRLIDAQLDPAHRDNSLWSDDWWIDWRDSITATDTAAPPVLDNLSAIRWSIPQLFPEWDAEEPGEGEDPDLSDLSQYNSRDHGARLPALLDLQVALLPDRIAARLPALPENQRSSFLRRHEIWYTTRFHFPNREGGRLP